MEKGQIISKYEGLLKIDLYNIPHPDWIFISSEKDIPINPKIDAPFGWTIRSCPKRNYAFKLPCKNKIDYKQVVYFWKKFNDETGNDQYIIYPSWEFKFSGGMILTFNELVVEVINGNIASLLEGIKTPDSVYYSTGPYFNTLIHKRGDEDLISLYFKKIFLRTGNKIFVNNYTVLEWSITSQGNIYFHDLVEF